MTGERKYFTKPQMESELEISDVTGTALLQKGEFPGAFQLRTRWRIPVVDVEKFKTRNGVKVEPVQTGGGA